jgi:hypothetical protein
MNSVQRSEPTASASILAIHHANLLAELRELELLRERVKNAELLCASRRKRTLVQPKKPSQLRKRHQLMSWQIGW